MNKEKISYEEFFSINTFYSRTAALQSEGQGWPVEPQKKQIQVDAPKALGQFLLDGGDNAARLYTGLDEGLLFFTEYYIVIDHLDDVLKKLRNPNNLRQVTFISSGDAQGLASKLWFPGAGAFNHPAKFQVLEFTPDKIHFIAEAQTDGIVNYLDNYHPAFKATMDGFPIKLYRTYGTFKGIFCPKGKHEITIVYDPLSFKIARALFWLSGVILLGLSVAAATRQSKWPRKTSFDL